MLTVLHDMFAGRPESPSAIDAPGSEPLAHVAVGRTATTYGSFDRFERVRSRAAQVQPAKPPACTSPLPLKSVKCPSLMVAHIEGLRATNTNVSSFSKSLELFMKQLAMGANCSLEHEQIEREDKNVSAFLQDTKFVTLHVFRVANCNARRVDAALRGHIPPDCAIKISSDGADGMQAIFASLQRVREESNLRSIARRLALLNLTPPEKLSAAEMPMGDHNTEFKFSGADSESPLNLALDMPEVESQRDLVRLVARVGRDLKVYAADRAQFIDAPNAHA